MEGLALLLSIVAMGVIVFWFMRNDRVPPDGSTTGLLAMRNPRSAENDKRPGRRNWNTARHRDDKTGTARRPKRQSSSQ